MRRSINLALPALLAWFCCQDAAAQVKVVKDTTYGEGSPFKVTASVNPTVTYFWWSVVDGYRFKILDPEAKTISGVLPRVTKDEYIRFRFSTKVKDSVAAQDIIIRIRNDVPDPLFTLAPPGSWNGTADVSVKPAIANLAQIRKCRFPTLRWSWHADSIPVDTAWGDSSVVLKSATVDGTLFLKLCLDNGGAANCKTSPIQVQVPVSLRSPAGTALSPRPAPFGSAIRRIDGRSAPSGVGRTVVFPLPIPDR